jgi:hypothetical protein
LSEVTGRVKEAALVRSSPSVGAVESSSLFGRVLPDWALIDVTEENESKYIDVTKLRLRQHQIEGVNGVIDRLVYNGVLLGDEMVIIFLLILIR